MKGVSHPSIQTYTNCEYKKHSNQAITKSKKLFNNKTKEKTTPKKHLTFYLEKLTLVEKEED